MQLPHTLHTPHTQHEQQLNEAKAMAWNRNLLGSRTVHALQFITKDTRQAFVSPALVDRMAAMLNYVLSKLVGPKSRELKVWLSLRVCVNYSKWCNNYATCKIIM